MRAWRKMPAKVESSVKVTPPSEDATAATGSAKPRRGMPPLPLASKTSYHCTGVSVYHARRKYCETIVLIVSVVDRSKFKFTKLESGVNTDVTEVAATSESGWNVVLFAA